MDRSSFDRLSSVIVREVIIVREEKHRKHFIEIISGIDLSKRGLEREKKGDRFFVNGNRK